MVSNSISYSQNSRYRYELNRKYKYELKAKSVEEEIYLIEVLVPDDYDSTRRYPIVYITDWWYYREYAPQFFRVFARNNVITPIIIVGIATLGDRTDWREERLRDLTPTHLPDLDRHDLPKLGLRGITGNAKYFLSFIKNELIPEVEAKYLSDTLNRGYVGYSYGGLFGAYILSSEPHLFQHYLLGSPSMQYDSFFMIDKLKEIAPDKLESVKSIVITVGEMEKGDDLKSFADLRDLILLMNIPNLKLESIIIEGETHSAAKLPTLTKGLRFLYRVR